MGRGRLGVSSKIRSPVAERYPGSVNLNITGLGTDAKFVLTAKQFIQFGGQSRMVEDLRVTYSTQAETELKIALTLDIVDPSYEAGDGDPEDPSTLNRLTIAEIAEAEQITSVFVPKLRGDAAIRLPRRKDFSARWRERTRTLNCDGSPYSIWESWMKRDLIIPTPWKSWCAFTIKRKTRKLKTLL